MSFTHRHTLPNSLLREVFQIVQIWQKSQNDINDKETAKIYSRILNYNNKVRRAIDEIPAWPRHERRQTINPCPACVESWELDDLANTLKSKLNFMIRNLNELLTDFGLATNEPIPELREHVYNIPNQTLNRKQSHVEG